MQNNFSYSKSNRFSNCISCNNILAVPSCVQWFSDFKLKFFFVFQFVDLQFSTDDEEFEEVVADFDTTAAVLGQGEALARSAQPINYLPGNVIL